MGIKKKLGMVMVTGALGLALVGGGTYAYFSDSVTTNNTFAAGTLDLTAEPTKIIDVDDLAPGDSVVRDFELENSGTVDMNKVPLATEYSLIDAEGDNGDDDLGKHIEVEF